MSSVFGPWATSTDARRRVAAAVVAKEVATSSLEAGDRSGVGVEVVVNVLVASSAAKVVCLVT